MKPVLDLTKEYGIVLEGGGAKGAYQVGVWRAFREAGLKIKGVSGASVGALNGALMCQDTLTLAEKLWGSISYGKVISGNEQLMETLFSKRSPAFTAKELLSLSGGEFKYLFSEAVKLFEQKGFDVTPLKKLIEKNIDPKKIKASKRELYVVTFSLDDKKELTIDVRDLPEDKICDMLLASAYFPAFRKERLNGKKFLDGGVLNNVPTDVLIKKGYRDIIEIRIYGLGFERPLKVPRGTNIYTVSPCEDLGGTLEFDKRQSAENMKLGYFDGLRLLYGLCGKRYYFACDEAGKLCYDFDAMETLGQALSVNRFRIYSPEQFLRKIRSLDAARVRAGEPSVFSETEKAGLFARLFSARKRKAE